MIKNGQTAAPLEPKMLRALWPSGPPGAFWGLLWPSEASCGLLGLPRAFWGLLWLSGVSCGLLGLPRAFWGLLGHFGAAFWGLL